jgi:hypothetical protein
MANSADALRRWLGAFFLAVAAGLLIWGQTVLLPYLHGIGFIVYWLVCFLCTIAAIVIALLDVRAVRRRIRNEQAELIQQTLKEIKESKDEPKGESD